jgi:hypothetical protein
MKTLVRIVLSFLALALAVFAVAYVDGSMLPVNHTVSITGIIPATPARTFAIITDVGGGAAWRSEVKAVQVLPPDRGRDHWIEDLGHNMKMDFVATATEPCSSEGHALRTILLNDPSYGGTWTYELTPGPTAGSTTLKITETGFINPPIYRFMMAHLFGPTRNLNIYMKDLQKKAI